MLRRASPFQLLILDCDGVVVDSEPIVMRILVEMLHELGVSIEAEEANERFIGTTFARTLELIAQLVGGPVPDDFVPNYRDRTFAALETELKPVPGIEAALDQIAIPYCIASNGPHAKMQRTLRITSLLPRFEGRMFSSADVPRGKPHPDLFLHAARRCGTPPAACLVVEDSASGIAAALAAGMSVHGFCGRAPEVRLRAAGAHGVFSRMSDLPALVTGIR